VEAKITQSELLAALGARYATKRFDPEKKIASELWTTLEETMRLAPSSLGIQPWKFYVINDQLLRETLAPTTGNKNQILEASHLVVFTTPLSLTNELLERHASRTAEVKGVTRESVQPFYNSMEGWLKSKSDEKDRDAWMGRQTYIALGFFLSACALLGVDACPMEGFDPAKADEILGIRKDGYKSLGMVAVGYRAADDKYATQAKVRFPKDEVVAYR